MKDQTRTSCFGHPDFSSLVRRVYRFLRGRGLDHHDTEDTTQDAMLRLWRNERARGANWQHFQRLAMVAAKHAHLSRIRAASAVKRGGGLRVASLEDSALASEIQSPDEFVAEGEQRNLAVEAIGAVRAGYVRRGQRALVDALESANFEPAKKTGAEVAAALDIAPATLRVAFHRYRARCTEAYARLVAR